MSRSTTNFNLDSIPPLVRFFYYAAFQSPAVFERNSIDYSYLLPAPPIKRADIKKALETVRLPAVCLHCRRIRGSLEGGKLYIGCPYCDGFNYPSEAWDRLGLINSMLGDWANDSLACHFLGELIDLGRPKPSTRRVVDRLTTVLEQAQIEKASKPIQAKPVIRTLSNKELAAAFDEL